MSNPMKSIRFTRGTFLSLIIAVLLLTCRAGSAQNEGHRIRNIVLVSRCLGGWFRLEGCLRHSGQGWLQRQHRPGTGDLLQTTTWLPRNESLICKMHRAFLSVTVMGEP